MNKILISTSSFNVENNHILQKLRDKRFEIVLNPHGRRLTEEEVAALLKDDVIGIIAGVEPLTRKVIKTASSLKVISRCGIGMENVDLKAAQDHNILVYNTPAAPTEAVAELTVGLILSVLRRIAEADRNLRSGRWKPLMGNLLSAQTVGLIGYGRIGKRVAQLLFSFGTRIVAFDVIDITPEKGIEVLSMDEVLAQSDVLTLHLPYNLSTRHIINKEKIGLMRKGAILINVSRGGIVDEEALFDALKSSVLAGAGFDTFEEEPYKGPLASLEQVVLTAHMGSYAKEARVEMELQAAKNLLEGLKNLE